MKTFNIISSFTEDALLAALDELSDESKAEFSTKLGEHGDLTYELKLLTKLITLIAKVYPPSSKDDEQMAELSQKLLDILPLLVKLT